MFSEQRCSAISDAYDGRGSVVRGASTGHEVVLRMGSGEDYRRFAAECLQLAEKITDPERKIALQAMAVAWERLAAFVDRPAILALTRPEGGDRT